MTTDVHSFWKMRAQKYNQLSWATENQYEKMFLDAGNFSKNDRVLDVGCGTGLMTKLVAPHVGSIVGLDISVDMLRQAAISTEPHELYLQGDMTALPFLENTFTKVTARMVLHHLMDKVQVGVDECHRVLDTGGEIIISEGIPPDPSIADWYTDMFRYKEERITFSQEILESLLKNAGFTAVHTQRYIMPQVSIGNWLGNSGIPADNQTKIMQMHRDLPEHGKKLYNATISKDDVRLDMHFLIVVGQK